jgi:hypothetical protein
LLHNPAEETKKCPPLGQHKEKVLLFDDINNNTAHRLGMRKIAGDLKNVPLIFFTRDVYIRTKMREEKTCE